MEKVSKIDWYYLRSGDWGVIPIGMFPETDEGRQAAFDHADTHAAAEGKTALLYIDVDGLIDLMDDLQRAFDATHPDK